MALIYTLLDESVSPQDVISSLNNKQGVVITYSDENSSAPDKRYIEPYVYGRTKAGNDAIRAYQYYGDTKRGVPKWKMFRLDRITSWNPTSQHFNAEPKERGWNAESYNENGDGSMVQVLNQVNISNGNNDTLARMRMKTANLKNSTPLNISQMSFSKKQSPNPSGPISANNAAAERNSNSSIPVHNQQTTDKGHEEDSQNTEGNAVQNKNGAIVNGTESAVKNNSPYNTEEFQNMLKRNLDITDKEKKRRSFSLS